MLDWSNYTPGSEHLVDEVLHSLFFLGKVNIPPYTPERIIGDNEMLEKLREKYPRPFEFYLTQLPKRSPFSCVLDMIVLQNRENNENQIIERLQDLVQELEENFLVSSTICVSQKSEGQNSVRHYGVSMSTHGKNPGRIVVGASCLTVWDDYVADAVMTYYPEADEKGQLGKEPRMKEYFDGTIELPKSIKCRAFRISTREEMHPCKSCGDLFGLVTNDEKCWPHGHCAEAESLSNLLKNEEDVKGTTRQKSPTCTSQNRARARESVFQTLNIVLKTTGFKKWNKQFYNPQP